MTSVEIIKIGTRESPLAMWQARHAQKLLQEKFPSITFELISRKTQGDKNTELPLSKFSDKGVFTKELDDILLNRQVDCAVHCVKDLPTVLDSRMEIICYLKREAPNDCILIDQAKHKNVTTLSQLPHGSKIGTSSLRRKALLRRFFRAQHPQAENVDDIYSIEEIRGNLGTRLNKLLKEQLFDAIMLAYVGVDRLEWTKRNNENVKDLCVTKLSDIQFPYCVGQGALALVCRSSKWTINSSEQSHDANLQSRFSQLNDIYTQLLCEAERSLLRELEGGCKVPVAVRTYR
ncbi:porphobilinogen deaminase [Reticulomyxa filosa]|uniref:hydroxymethylbilane synthase n=1 Tax=Reticulomyxa filosa TaxID=46433 RepID=X6MPJ9_RETFI|nr:porphobilinogen deaminase [Reticulomyxa filosa]|eukprot:ETO15352.1 porphobilinogen deaminase [Reticulomyxa filosa]